MLIQILIILGCLFVFVVTFLLNKKTKANINEEDIELPEQCLTCHNKSCLEKKMKNLNIDKCEEGENKNE